MNDKNANTEEVTQIENTDVNSDSYIKDKSIFTLNSILNSSIVHSSIIQCESIIQKHLCDIYERIQLYKDRFLRSLALKNIDNDPSCLSIEDFNICINTANSIQKLFQEYSKTSLAICFYPYWNQSNSTCACFTISNSLNPVLELVCDLKDNIEHIEHRDEFGFYRITNDIIEILDAFIKTWGKYFIKFYSKEKKDSIPHFYIKDIHKQFTLITYIIGIYAMHLATKYFEYDGKTITRISS